MCNSKLHDIQGKLDKLLSVLPEIRDLKIQVAKLEKEKEELRASLESTQVEVEVLKEQASVTAATLKITTDKIVKLEELKHRAVKQECLIEEITSNSSALAITSRNPQKKQKQS